MGKSRNGVKIAFAVIAFLAIFFFTSTQAHADPNATGLVLWLDATEPENPVELGQRIYLGTGDEYQWALRI